MSARGSSLPPVSASMLDAVSDLMRETAAEYIMPRFQNLGDLDVDTKTSADDYVTIADRESELALTPRLMEMLPGSVVVGEEAVSANADLLDHLSGDQPVWVVDPVDGTLNFVHGRAEFGMMVALVHGGETRAGWIYAPVANTMARSVQGDGVTIDGTNVAPPASTPYQNAHGDFSSQFFKPPLREVFFETTQKTACVRQGRCSAHAYLSLIRGEIDYILQYYMSPWDHAAGALMVHEVGGAARFLETGSAYRPIRQSACPMLATGNAAQWNDYASALFPGAATALDD